jgi:hypothetical protein
LNFSHVFSVFSPPFHHVFSLHLFLYLSQTSNKR